MPADRCSQIFVKLTEAQQTEECLNLPHGKLKVKTFP